jgi:hypothetical protein
LAPTTSLAGDAFLKLGLTFHPDLGGFSNEWFISVGSDWGFHPQGYVGLEFQGAYRSTSAENASSKTVPANVLVNVKWKSEAESVRPYAGVGFGLISTYVRVTAFDRSENEWFRNAGFQLMGGVELNRRFAVELMGQRILVEGAQFRWSVLGGLRW